MRLRYGSAQVCEFELSAEDVARMVSQSVAERCDPRYDFDKKNPLVIQTENGGFIIRFVQKKATHDADRGEVWMKPLPKSKQEPS